MTRALVTQMLDANTALLSLARREAPAISGKVFGYCEEAILAARAYLETEPSGERAELIAQLRDAHGRRFDTSPSPYSRAADMLEADAQQAKRVPMTEKQIDKIHANTARLAQIRTTFFIAFARAIEAHHGITPAEKPTVDEPEEEDLYALALKADNWGQP